jgi:hypothetical protein
MAVADTTLSGNPANIKSLLATTLPAYSKTMADNVFNAIPLLALLNEKNRTTESGGAQLFRPVMYSKNTTASDYAADDVLDTTIQDPFSVANYLWKQYAASISVTGREEMQNRGKQEMIDIVQAKIKHAESSIKDKLNVDLFASSQVGNKITPIPAIISASGTCGDISATTYAWWASKSQTSGSFSARGLADLRSVWNQTVLLNPVGPCDGLISDRTAFEYYESTLVPQLRLSDTKMGDLGFENFKYKGATWMFDLNATSGTIYGINTNTIELVTHADRRFVMSEWVKPADQDLKVAQIFYMGELTCNNRRKNFVVSSITA